MLDKGEVSVLTESLTSLMEPLLIIFLGGAVGFIDQEQVRFRIEVKKTMQIDSRIEGIVVVADDAIHPQSQIQRELERANLILPGDLFNDRAGESLMLIKFLKRSFHFVKITTGKYTHIRVTVDRRAKTDLFFGRQGHAFQM